jgi:hypothetical protein
MYNRLLHTNTSTGVKNVILNTIEGGVKNIGVPSAEDLELFEGPLIAQIFETDSVIEDNKDFYYRAMGEEAPPRPLKDYEYKPPLDDEFARLAVSFSSSMEEDIKEINKANDNT